MYGGVRTKYSSKKCLWRTKTSAIRYASRAVPHGASRLDENGLDWEDGHIAYRKLCTAVRQAVGEFAHLYSYGTTKCKLLSELLGRPNLDLQDFNRPPPSAFKRKLSYSMPCHGFPDVCCATKNAHSLHDWLKYCRSRNI